MTKAETIKLLACPFCGDEARVIGEHPDEEVICINAECGATMFLMLTEHGTIPAIAAWNRRAEVKK